MNTNSMRIALSEPHTQFSREEFVSPCFPQKVFSALWVVEAEGNHGGFSRYYSNTRAENALLVEAALELIRGLKTANICKRAMTRAFPDGLPTTEEEISSARANFSDEVLAASQPLDQEFFADRHDPTDILFADVPQHAEEFGPLPKLDAA